MHANMQFPYELAVGWRYTRAGRATRRNGFISFISGVSMLGIALGVAALIIVLSVMNGFQKEVRDRMLSVVSHVEIFAPQGAPLPDVERTLREARSNPDVVGAAPFVSAQALLARGEDMKGALVRGIDPAREGEVTDLAATSGEVLKRLGAEVVYPEADMAVRIGKRLISGNLLDYIALGDGVEVRRIAVGGKMLGKSVRQLDVRKVYGINIIAVEHGQQTNVEFSADYTFKEGDTVAVIGKVGKIDKFEKEM